MAGLDLRRATFLACTALMAAGCTGTAPAALTSPEATPPVPNSAAAAAGYARIARAGNHRLEIDLDGLHGHDRADLAAAEADLRDAAATERLFDRRLLALPLPPQAKPVARLLYRANQARAGVSAAAARSTSLRQLRADERKLTAANRPVEEGVRVLRDVLGLPPPQTS